MEVKELHFGHRRVCLYQLVKGAAPLVYSIDYHENGQLLLEACRQVGCDGFNLVTISGLHWNQELSPWPVDTVVSKDDNFSGGAPQWLPLLTDEVVPQVERLLDAPPTWRMLAGYSLAGLFAVWTAFQCDLFTRILSASGSMWYPGWLEYAKEHETAAPLQGIYLSVGDKESTSRNAVLQTVGERTRAMADLMAVVVPLGHAFGRIGCFFNGCCYGKQTDSAFGVSFPAMSPAWCEQVREHLISSTADKALPVLPTQLFEAAGCLVIFAIVLAVYLKSNCPASEGSPAAKKAAGISAAVYLASYGVLRFLLELLRGDPRAAVLGLSIGQAISLGVFVVGLVFAIAAYRRRR